MTVPNEESGQAAGSQPSSGAWDDEPVPPMQQLLDNPFALLFLGIALPTVLYIVWGVMEILTVPISPLAK
jgi:hypothetical protein